METQPQATSEPFAMREAAQCLAALRAHFEVCGHEFKVKTTCTGVCFSPAFFSYLVKVKE
jgi:hypothetical protein